VVNARFTLLVLGDGLLDLDALVGAEAQFVFLARRQLRQYAISGEHAVAEQRHRPGQHRLRCFRQFQARIQVSGDVQARHGEHQQRRVEALGSQLHALGFARRPDGGAAGDGVDGLNALFRSGTVVTALRPMAGAGAISNSLLDNDCDAGAAGRALPANCGAKSMLSISGWRAAVARPGRVVDSERATSSQSSTASVEPGGTWS
jgi:hypothetical protein